MLALAGDGMRLLAFVDAAAMRVGESTAALQLGDDEVLKGRDFWKREECSRSIRNSRNGNKGAAGAAWDWFGGSMDGPGFGSAIAWPAQVA